MKLRSALALLLLLSGCVMHLVDRMTGEDQANLIRKTGTPATARVLKIWDTGMTVNDNPVVGFRLEVHPADGDAFQAETRALIGRLDVAQVQPGAELPVKYDPNDHTKVALDIYEERGSS